MSLWSTIKDALGLTPPIVPAPPAPFGPTKRARRQLERLSGQTLRVSTEPTPDGRRVRLQLLDVPPPPELDLPLMVSERDRDHLAGLKLDHDGTDWRLTVDLRVRGIETPNPSVRLYETSRPLIDGRPLHVTAGDDAPGLAGRIMAIPGVVSILVRDHTVSVEKDGSTSWAVLDREVPAALRAHFLACGPPLTPEAIGRADDPAWRAVADVMTAEVLPYVHQHGGDIQLIDVEDGVVTVALHGACASCPASMLTLKGGVQRHLREALPDLVDRVEAVTVD